MCSCFRTVSIKLIGRNSSRATFVSVCSVLLDQRWRSEVPSEFLCCPPERPPPVTPDLGQMGPLVAVPILAGLNGVLGMWAVFGVAWLSGTVTLTEHFPYISTCGDQPPASCWFSQVCNIGCVLALIFETLRFRRLKDCPKCSSRLNIASFSLGIISSVGLSITGNFQVSSIKSVHYIGAFLGFAGGLAYLWIQLLLISNWILKYCGYALCSVCTVLLCCLVGFHHARRYHAAAICEWTLATLFFLLYPLFVFEFADIKCKLTIKSLGCGQHGSTEPQYQPGDSDSATPL
ncbi:modulator of macroautophagy TMEM150B [Poecilia latipinna]|uniref:modulator of macroautophagy TMEM150B n=1 Tax=Poecilia latipinna TaxID=48699 RepID=UPI00072E1C66|nr:PREDICTED: transmembrane protein 150B-like [Poecilia latipinna]